MAKKKTSSQGSEGGKKPSRASVARQRKAPKPSTSPAQGPPLVDTDLAAANAARMLAARAKLHIDPTKGQASEQKESGLIKQLKESINRPATHAVNAAMGNTFGPQKTSLPTHELNRQVAHDQVQGGPNRVNVPRRTAG